MLNTYSLKDEKYTNFRTEGEESIYVILQNRYPSSYGWTVLYNVKLRDYIDLEDIYECFKKEKADYASICYVDFLILKDGIPYKVYELQDDECHNEPEWIEKDKIKKAACLVSGLKFEEYF